jgi:hypothetical protein
MDCDQNAGEHAAVMARLGNDEILIGVDAAAARRFFTDNSAAALRQQFGEGFALRRSVVMLAFVMAPVTALASAALAIRAFGWWSIGVVPVSLAAWFLHSSMASSGRQRVFGVFCFFAASVAVCVAHLAYTYMPAQVWLAVLSGAFLLSRLTYYSASGFVESLVIRNPIAYEFLLGQAVFFREAESDVKLPPRPTR